MNLDPVADLLARRIGLDPASLGTTVLPAAVAEGMRALGLADPVAYAGALAERPEAFDALADRLVVPETWFFRGAGLFAELARQVAAALPALAGRPFRALSLPCSTGEEPYSLAIALLEAGLAPERWSIDGIDLSPRLLESARRGAYREFSFRETDPTLRERNFRPAGDRWELSAGVRGLVHFQAGNLLAPTLAADVSGTFDLVLCRNLLIYLTPAARRQALAALEGLLAPGGLLGVGHAEPQVLAGRPFRRVGANGLFLFRHDSPGLASGRGPGEPAALAAGSASAAGWGVHPATATNPAANAGPATHAGPAAHADPAAATNPAANAAGSPGPRPLAEREEGLARARRLADGGRLDEALAACQTYVNGTGPSADAYSLLGVIQQARGDRDGAAASFRKALYLDPEHREALTHAMLLSAQRGDAGQAALLRGRLKRTDPGGEP